MCVNEVVSVFAFHVTCFYVYIRLFLTLEWIQHLSSTIQRTWKTSIQTMIPMYDGHLFSSSQSNVQSSSFPWTYSHIPLILNLDTSCIYSFRITAQQWEHILKKVKEWKRTGTCKPLCLLYAQVYQTNPPKPQAQLDKSVACLQSEYIQICYYISTKLTFNSWKVGAKWT